MSHDKKGFFLRFLVAGFLMKKIAEIIHEIFGHGLFVLLFGGEIVNVHISILWPYELSYINWRLPSTVTHLQLVWIYAGGIMPVCVVFGSNLFVFKKKIAWFLALVGFWLAFWPLANSTGYLILGGLMPLGMSMSLLD